MPIRDLLIMVTVLTLVPFCLFRPWVGLLVWSWVSYMNPHRLAWGFAHDFPFAMLVAGAVLSGFLFASDRKAFLWTRESVLLLGLGLWFTVTTMFAMYPEPAWLKWQEVSKILLMALLTIFFFQDRARLRALLFVIAGSIGFYGVKGGLFTLATGGHFQVLGPPDSFFEANTETSVTLTMALPIILFLAREETRRWLRLLLRAMFALTVIAVPFTYSRSGIVGLAIVLGMLFLSARRRVLMMPVVVLAAVAFMWYAPERLVERIQTLENVEADESAQLRFMSWQVGYRIVADRPVVGGGFRVFLQRATYDLYLPDYPRPFGHDAHSIYFNLLGEHGWVGLGIFLTLIASTFLTLNRLRRIGAEAPEVAWISNYARAVQVSLVAYLISGLALSLAYFDLAYQLFVITIILEGLARQEKAANTVSAAAQAAVPMVSPARPSRERV
jgi:probable O-glycosylation ligase (exosortase A-associated)